MSDHFFDDLLPGVLRSEIAKKNHTVDELTKDEVSEAISEGPTPHEKKTDIETSENAEPLKQKANQIQQKVKAQPNDEQYDVHSEQFLEKTTLFGCPIEEQRAKSGWGILGRISGNVARMDLQYPKLMAIFGQIRSGKSYLAGVLTEMSVMRLSGINDFPGQESAVIIFNYRKSREARFEYWSFVHENNSMREINMLRDIYKASPCALPPKNIQVCAYSRELPYRQENEYANMKSLPLLFRSEDLEDDDWMLLMGLPDPDRVYIQVMRNIVEDLGYDNSLSLDNLRLEVDRTSSLSDSQKKIANLRLDFATRYVDDANGIKWDEIVRPGTVTVIDLRRRQGRADDALRLCLVVLSAIRNLDRNFHKFVLFDEFHEYYNSNFSENLDNAARMVGHHNWSLCFATQNTHKVDMNLLRLFTNKFVFQVDSTTWNDLSSSDERLKILDYADVSTLQRERGECYSLLDDCNDNRYAGVPIKMNVRPRATQHGGTTAGQD